MNIRSLKNSTARRSVTREGLLDAALQLFLTHGFAATRVEDIARLAGVSKGSVYLHFKTKDEVFQAVVDAGVVARIEHAEEFAADFSGSSTELLTAMLSNNFLEFWGSPLSGIPKLIVAESEQFPGLASSYYRNITLRARRIIERILQQGVDRSEYKAVDVSYAARCILNALDYELIIAHSQGDHSEPDIEPQRFIETLLSIVVTGLNATNKKNSNTNLNGAN